MKNGYIDIDVGVIRFLYPLWSLNNVRLTILDGKHPLIENNQSMKLPTVCQILRYVKLPSKTSVSIFLGNHARYTATNSTVNIVYLYGLAYKLFMHNCI